MKLKMYGVSYYDIDENYIVVTSINPFALSSKDVKGIKKINIIDDKKNQIMLIPFAFTDKIIDVLIAIDSDKCDLIITGEIQDIETTELKRFYQNEFSYKAAFFNINQTKMNHCKRLIKLQLCEVAHKKIGKKDYPNKISITKQGQELLDHLMRVDANYYNKVLQKQAKSN
jgi:hypothetical protein